MKKFEINNLIRDNIKNMKPYSSARDEFSEVSTDLIFLDANENPFENGINRYPDPQQKTLKKLISEIKKTQENQILLGNGSDEVLDLLFRAFCEPNFDNVITLPPTYGMYGVLANLNAVKNIEIPLSKSFEIEIEQILSAINAKTKIIFICSPNNPTGNSVNIEDIEKILNNFDGLVVIDEAYIDFSENKSWLEKMSKYSNLVIVQTLSKAFGMAGIRLGMLFASPEIIVVLNKIKPPYNVNILTQKKAKEFLTDATKTQKDIKSILEQKKYLISAFLTINFIEKIYPSDTNFLLLKVDDAIFRYQQILEKGIVARNRTNDILCDNCIRITIGTETENQKLIDVLKSLS